ncbi:Cna protein B-type domain containing protein, partial [bacterium]
MNRREFNRNFAIAAGAIGFQPLTRLAQAQMNQAQPNDVTVTASKNGAPVSASGIVYGERDGRKFPLPKVRVSNGREIAITDRLGRYSLPVTEGDIIFVVKPRDYALPLNDINLPQFYRIHKQQGSPKQEFPGIKPTGPLPSQVNFTLKYQKESDEFRVLLFGDPQSRNQEEIGFMMRDVIGDVIGQKAAFGISLGDIAFNDLSIYENHNRAVALLDIPWFNLIGNHDLNFDAADRKDSVETYKSLYGPPYYSFDVGSTHFVV